MLGYIWAFMIGGGIAFSCFNGRLAGMSQAILDGAGQGVTLSLSMMGVLAMWCGILEILKEAGIVKILSKFMMPFINWLFPRLKGADGESAREYIALNFIMNILGTGASATGAGLMAMKELDKHPHTEGCATPEMCAFLVMNISSLQLIPVNIIAYRNAYGSANPEAIIIPAIMATAVSTVAAVIFIKLIGVRKKHG